SAGSSSKDSIFVLQANQIDTSEIQKVGGLPVGSYVIFRQFEPHSGRIGVTLFSIVNRECQQFRRTVFRMEGVAQICSERRDATVPRKVVSHDRDSPWKYRAQRCKREIDCLLFQYERGRVH